MPQTDPSLLSATALLDHYRAHTLSPVEVVEACLARIEALNPRLNAFLLVDAAGARAAARAAEARWAMGQPIGPLDGVPTSIKDIVLTRGWPTRRGSRTVDAAQAWAEDAPATARLREAGAILIGKTTTPEFGWKGVTDSPLTGITRNPWNPELTPGGSSGGAAVAAATGMAALHVGTDGGGSIRIPASFTGVFGFKPSYGRVPAYPLSPFGTLAHLGPLTRTVADAVLMLRVISQPDPRDWTAVPIAPPADPGPGDVRGLRVAFAPTLNGRAVDAEVAAAVARTAATLAALGARVTEAAPPLAGADAVFFGHWAAGVAALTAAVAAEKQALMDPGLLAMGRQGARLPLLDHLQAVQARGRLAIAMNLFHRDHDLLLLPTMPLTAFAAGHNTPPDGPFAGWHDWTPFTYPFNLTQQPAASLPCGLSTAGLPIGCQIVGRLHDDATVLRACLALEQAQPWPLPDLKAL